MDFAPAPRAHQVRYHGVLAPCAGWRDRVVPAGPYPGRAVRPECCRKGPCEETRLLAAGGDDASLERREADPSSPFGSGRTVRRYAWGDLLRRVFAVDVLERPDRFGRMRILAAIHPPDTTRVILECLGLPVRAPPIAPARLEPEFPEPAPPAW